MNPNLMISTALTARGMAFHSMTHTVLAIVVPLKPNIPLDPPDIVSKNDEGFSINMNNMERSKPYMMTFEDSKFVLWKNKDGALVIKEI